MAGKGENEKTKDELIAELQRKYAQLSAEKAALEQQNETICHNGSGATATRGGTAAGAGGVAVGRDFHGNVYVGTTPGTDPDEALRIYYQSLVVRYAGLPLRGIHQNTGDATAGQKPLDLAGVYVGLDTTARITEKDKLQDKDDNQPLSALAAAAANSRLVLLGDPGSGKSTFVNHLTLCVARHQLGQADAAQLLSGWPEAYLDLLPIPVILRDFAAQGTEAGKQHGAASLYSFIHNRLKNDRLDFLTTHLDAHLENGRALLILDGLDEVGADRREFVRTAIAAFIERYGSCRVLATCRILSYRKAGWQLGDGFTTFTLAPLNQDKIDSFIAAWYQELLKTGTVKEESKAWSLTEQLRAETRRDYLRELAPNPLLLTIMAVVHTHSGRLPGSRTVLYAECIDILLERWEQLKAADQGSDAAISELLAIAGRQKMDLLRMLRRLAFDVHGNKGRDLADIGRLELLEALARLHPQSSLDWAKQVIAVMRDRAGVLIERDDGIYTFPHRTFQEYLAGAYLAGLGNFSRQAFDLSDDPNWRQPILLAVGHLTFDTMQSDPVLALLHRFCPEIMEDSSAAWRRAWLAGDAVLEMERQRLLDDNGKSLDLRIRTRLAELINRGVLEPGERAAAGTTLGKLADPRFRPDRWFLPDEDLLGFVEIPEGEFFMGDDEDEDARPCHPIHLGGYFIGRYPVTVDQFRVFVTESGFQPSDKDSLDGVGNHPVTWVNWKDVQAYCRWLDSELRRLPETPELLTDLLDKGWRVRLPSEAEWEKAARGKDGRTYPWGEEPPNAESANNQETALDTTSTVGCFPNGASPFGLYDCSGNVWEWTRSLWGNKWRKPEFDYPYDPGDTKREDEEAGDRVLRVFRGGSYYDSGRILCCARRDRDFPGYWGRSRGFRIVLAPDSPL